MTQGLKAIFERGGGLLPGRPYVSGEFWGNLQVQSSDVITGSNYGKKSAKATAGWGYENRSETICKYENAQGLETNRKMQENAQLPGFISDAIKSWGTYMRRPRILRS